MIDRIEKWMDEKRMLPEQGLVIAAVSGGADSVCLLAVLLYLAPSHGWTVRALHLNHCIRGEEADRDEAFVRDLCRKWEVELSVVREDVPAYARENGLSLEESGRICRLRALESAAKEWEKSDDILHRTVMVALAHHADDNAETIIHHLLRGSGLRGLGGIRPVQGRLIRPLLSVRRIDIREFLLDNEIEWREDSTNADTAYTRNRIRNDIIPLMEKEVNPHAVDNIVHAGNLIAQADSTFMEHAEEIFARSGWVKEDEAGIDLTAFLEQSPVVRSYLFRIMIDLAAPGLRDITARHFSLLNSLAAGETGKRVDLPGGLMAGRDYDKLWIRRVKESDPVTEAVWDPTPEGGSAGEIDFCVFARQKGVEIPRNKWSKWFDYDKISGALSVRTRREGDYLTLAGGGRKSLSRFLIDEKIPRDDRDNILLLAEGSHILWVVGLRISEYYKVTEKTKYILQAEKEG